MLIALAGLLTFGVVFTLLEYGRSEAAPGKAQVAPAPDATSTPAPVVAADSLAARVQAGRVALGVPITGSEVLLRDAQPGDRLDILASLTSAQDAQPVTAVVVHGATVLRPPSSSDPLLVEVQPPDAIALAHLVMGGTRLGYIVWPGGGNDPVSAEPPALDVRSARSLLGLPVTATVVSRVEPTVPPVPTRAAQPPAVTPEPRTGSGFLYQVQTGDTWDSIAATFGLPAAQLREWNEVGSDEDPTSGRLVFIPRPS